MITRLSTIGLKRRPIAVGGTIRQGFASAWCREYSPQLGNMFREVGGFGIASSGGVEEVALWAKILREADKWLITLDAANAFNSVFRAAIIRNAAVHRSARLPFVIRC